MNGNIDGTDPVADDAVNVTFSHIGQCHKVSLKKGQPGIIIFEIQGLPHPRRQLIDETEDAVVGTAVGFVHDPGFKGQSQFFIRIFSDADGKFREILSAAALDRQIKGFGCCQIAVVENILDQHFIDPDQPVLGPDPCTIGGTARVHFSDQVSLAWPDDFTVDLNESVIAHRNTSFL